MPKRANETSSVAQFVSPSGAIVPSETVDFCDAESFNTYQGLKLKLNLKIYNGNFFIYALFLQLQYFGTIL